MTVIINFYSTVVECTTKFINIKKLKFNVEFSLTAAIIGIV
jgi:hypothetical protein